MSYLNEKLKSYPKIHKYYEGLHSVYSKYIEYLPFWLICAKKSQQYNNDNAIFFYPAKPELYHAITQICLYGNIKISSDLKTSNAVMHFEDTTIRKYDSYIQSLNKKNKIINYKCNDISKVKVGKMHKEAFGYDIAVDPRTYKGKYVKKYNSNALHFGLVIDKNEDIDTSFAYQRLVNNIYDDELILLRVPIISDSIPFVYYKHRDKNELFDSKNKLVEVKETKEIFSEIEIVQILKFARLMGLDCGELDVLRDNKNGKIYVCDCNNTPTCPPSNTKMKEYEKAIRLMTNAFVEKFLS